LELGCGGGNNAFHLKKHFELTLTDRSPRMLDQSRTINPECQHVEGDMRSLRLSREFDAVFVHDAVSCLTTREDLQACMETAFVHCKSAGAALFMPDMVRECFRTGVHHGGHDCPVASSRSLRYLEWTFDPDPEDNSYTVDFAYLLREGKGPVRVEHDTHIMGLFSRADWLELLTSTGFDSRVVQDPWDREVFVGKKP
jgi:SAM-dependent methyltransferase